MMRCGEIPRLLAVSLPQPALPRGSFTVGLSSLGCSTFLSFLEFFNPRKQIIERHLARMICAGKVLISGRAPLDSALTSSRW